MNKRSAAPFDVTKKPRTSNNSPADSKIANSNNSPADSNNSPIDTDLKPIDVDYLFDNINGALDHAIYDQDFPMVNKCSHCGEWIDEVIEFDSITNMKIRNRKCGSCDKEIDVKRSYYLLAKFFENLAKIYMDITEKVDDSVNVTLGESIPNRA